MLLQISRYPFCSKIWSFCSLKLTSTVRHVCCIALFICHHFLALFKWISINIGFNFSSSPRDVPLTQTRLPWCSCTPDFIFSSNDEILENASSRGRSHVYCFYCRSVRWNFKSVCVCSGYFSSVKVPMVRFSWTVTGGDLWQAMGDPQVGGTLRVVHDSK